MIREFQHHHRRPMDATRTSCIAAMWGAARFTTPLSITAVLLPSGLMMQTFLATLLAGIAISQHSHNLAHIPAHQRSWWLKLLQTARLFLPHRTHVKNHHHTPWHEHFEPLAGWWSLAFCLMGYNRAEERLLWYLLRAVPRTWERPELAPPSYLCEAMHWRGGYERLRFDWQSRKLTACCSRKAALFGLPSNNP
jgi:hypothetical protein